MVRYPFLKRFFFTCGVVSRNTSIVSVFSWLSYVRLKPPKFGGMWTHGYFCACHKTYLYLYIRSWIVPFNVVISHLFRMNTYWWYCMLRHFILTVRYIHIYIWVAIFHIALSPAMLLCYAKICFYFSWQTFRKNTCLMATRLGSGHHGGVLFRSNGGGAWQDRWCQVRGSAWDEGPKTEMSRWRSPGIKGERISGLFHPK